MTIIGEPQCLQDEAGGLAVLTSHIRCPDWRMGRWMSGWSRCLNPPWQDS
ncbi:hypothetical protein AWB81_07038 [Caballeronia arationis]|nr:hypothetical protein AWB81_07038 [Caballeronia arationis]